MRKDIKLEDLELYESNPREITKENLEKLKRDLQKDPEFLKKRPVLVNRIKGRNIVYAGNQRLLAARALKWATIHCDVDENVPEALMRSRVIIDNIEYGEWDHDKLANEWQEDLQRIDPPEHELGYLNEWDPDNENYKNDEKEIDELEIENECPSCGYKW